MGVKYYKKLRNKKYILEYGKYIVEGEHLVEEASKSGLLESIIVNKENKYDYDVSVEVLTLKEMKDISLLNSVPDIMGVVRLKTNEEILGNRIVVLDDVQDPGNVGTIIRSALAFNVDTVILSEGSVSLYNDKMIRSSEGTIFKMNVVRMNIENAIMKIKSKGIKVYYADMHGTESLDDIKLDSYALVLGSEGQGISDKVRKMADSSISIPINNACESLNVAVSGGIIMYKFR